MNEDILLTRLEEISNKLDEITQNVKSSKSPLNKNYLNTFTSLIEEIDELSKHHNIEYIQDKIAKQQVAIENIIRKIANETFERSDQIERYKKHKSTFQPSQQNQEVSSKKTSSKTSSRHILVSPYHSTERMPLGLREHGHITARQPQYAFTDNFLDNIKAAILAAESHKEQKKNFKGRVKQGFKTSYYVMEAVKQFLDVKWEKAFSIFGINRVREAKSFYLNQVDDFLKLDKVNRGTYLKTIITNLKMVEGIIKSHAQYNRITRPIRFVPHVIYRITASLLTFNPLKIGNNIRSITTELKNIINIRNYELDAYKNIKGLRSDLEKYYEYKKNIRDVDENKIKQVNQKFSKLSKKINRVVEEFKINIYKNSSKQNKNAILRVFHDKMRQLFPQQSPLLKRDLLDTLDAKKAFRNFKGKLTFPRRVINSIYGLTFELKVLWLDTKIIANIVKSTFKSIGVTDTSKLFGKFVFSLLKLSYNNMVSLYSFLSPSIINSIKSVTSLGWRTTKNTYLRIFFPEIIEQQRLKSQNVKIIRNRLSHLFKVEDSEVQSKRSTHQLKSWKREIINKSCEQPLNTKPLLKTQSPSLGKQQINSLYCGIPLTKETYTEFVKLAKQTPDVLKKGAKVSLMGWSTFKHIIHNKDMIGKGQYSDAAKSNLSFFATLIALNPGAYSKLGLHGISKFVSGLNIAGLPLIAYDLGKNGEYYADLFAKHVPGIDIQQTIPYTDVSYTYAAYWTLSHIHSTELHIDGQKYELGLKHMAQGIDEIIENSGKGFAKTKKVYVVTKDRDGNILTKGWEKFYLSYLDHPKGPIYAKWTKYPVKKIHGKDHMIINGNEYPVKPGETAKEVLHRTALAKIATNRKYQAMLKAIEERLARRSQGIYTKLKYVPQTIALTIAHGDVRYKYDKGYLAYPGQDIFISKNNVFIGMPEKYNQFKKHVNNSIFNGKIIISKPTQNHKNLDLKTYTIHETAAIYQSNDTALGTRVVFHNKPSEGLSHTDAVFIRNKNTGKLESHIAGDMFAFQNKAYIEKINGFNSRSRQNPLGSPKRLDLTNSDKKQRSLIAFNH